jgi:dCTP deaminase
LSGSAVTEAPSTALAAIDVAICCDTHEFAGYAEALLSAKGRRGVALILGGPVTTLSDADISAEMALGRLIKKGDARQLAGACYELRLGDVYYDLTEDDRRIHVAPGQDILIKPGHRVVLITHEELEVPHNVLTRVVSKGSLFSVGLSPVATYADPGFSGNLGIVTQNISDKYIALPQLEPIAKADFTRLTSEVNHPYRGQHGFSMQIWPIKHQLQKSHADVAGDLRVGTEKEEGYRLLPQATAGVLRKLERRQFLTDAAIVLAVILNAAAVFLVGNKLLDNFQGLVGNLVASVLVGLIVLYANRRQ